MKCLRNYCIADWASMCSLNAHTNTFCSLLFCVKIQQSKIKSFCKKEKKKQKCLHSIGICIGMPHHMPAAKIRHKERAEMNKKKYQTFLNTKNRAMNFRITTLTYSIAKKSSNWLSHIVCDWSQYLHIKIIELLRIVARLQNHLEIQHCSTNSMYYKKRHKIQICILQLSWDCFVWIARNRYIYTYIFLLCFTIQVSA